MPGHRLITQRSEQSMPEHFKLYLDQMFQLDVAHALRGEGYDVIKLLLPFLRLYSSGQFKNHLVIVSPKRSKWVRTA